MSGLKAFYDAYHQKNGRYSRVMGKNNITYFYILRTLQEAFKKQTGEPLETALRSYRVLDVGCGVGTLALYLAQYAKRVTGIDVSARAIELARRAQKATQSTNSTFRRMELQREHDTFDLVTCTEVIEHIADDGQFLRDISKRLQTGGLLLLTTPSLENEAYHRGWYKHFDQEVGHLRRYTTKGLLRLLKKNGFMPLVVHEVEGPLRNLLYTTRAGVMLKFIKGPLVPLFHWFDMASIKFWGHSDIQVVASKKF